MRYSDSFARADSSDLGASWDAGYTSYNGLRITGQRVRVTTLGTPDSAESYNAFTFGAAQFAQITLPTWDSALQDRHGGIVLRAATPSTATFYFAAASTSVAANRSIIRKVVAGTETDLGEVANTWAANDILIGDVVGSNLNLFRNGTLVFSATDSAIASGRPGLYGYVGVSGALTDLEIDNWIGGDVPISFVSAGTEGEAASGNCTPGLPGSIQANDILICACHSSDQVAHSMTSDWTQIVQGNGGSTTSRLSVWWHRYNGTSSPSAVITHSAGNGIIAGIVALRGCKTSGSPVNVAGTIAAGTTATIAHNSITPTVDFCALLIINGAADDNVRTLVTGTASLLEDTTASTQNAFIGTLGAVDESVSIFMREVMAAATGTINVTQAAADPCAGVLVALEPEVLAEYIVPVRANIMSGGGYIGRIPA